MSLPYNPKCLDVAVDHRIQALFKRVSDRRRADTSANHARRVIELGGHMEKSEAEIAVTQGFTGPGYTGGIMIILLQPSNYHPFDYGLLRVIQASPTLAALDEAFSAVSCGSVTLRDSTVSLIDSLPYLSPVDRITTTGKEALRKWTSKIIRNKRPDVVLCMWQDKDGVTSRMDQVRSLGVGKEFNSSEISFGGGVTFQRVNGFHPSYAVNYNCYNSCFRQLLLLQIAKSCHMYDGEWSEAEWMRELRDRCQSMASRMSRVDTSDLGFCIVHLSDTLTRIQEFMVSWITTTGRAKTKPSNVYDALTRARISEKFNDANLCIQELWKCDNYIHKDDISEYDRKSISDSACKCFSLLKNTVDKIFADKTVRRNRTTSTSGFFEENDLTRLLEQRITTAAADMQEIPRIFCRILKRLNRLFTCVQTGGKTDYTVELRRLWNFFLSAAVTIEDHLRVLKDRHEKLKEEEKLSLDFAGLGISRD